MHDTAGIKLSLPTTLIRPALLHILNHCVLITLITCQLPPRSVSQVAEDARTGKDRPSTARQHRVRLCQWPFPLAAQGEQAWLRRGHALAKVAMAGRGS